MCAVYHTTPTDYRCSPSLPALVYLNYVWTPSSVRNFRQLSHRARFVFSDALLNRLPDATPLYCFQFVHHGTMSLYATTHLSFFILQTPHAKEPPTASGTSTAQSTSSYYLVPASELEDVLGHSIRLGGWPHLNGLKWFLHPQTAENVNRRDRLVGYSCQGAEALYLKVVEACREETFSCTAKALYDSVSRPDDKIRGTVRRRLGLESLEAEDPTLDALEDLLGPAPRQPNLSAGSSRLHERKKRQPRASSES